MSELSQIHEAPMDLEAPAQSSKPPPSWGRHGPGALRNGGARTAQWTSPVVQNPLFAGELWQQQECPSKTISGAMTYLCGTIIVCGMTYQFCALA